MLPAAIYLLVMFVYPFAYGVVLSLQAKDGGLSLANYLAFLLDPWQARTIRSEEHTSELQSLAYLVCRLLLEKKKVNSKATTQWRKTESANGSNLSGVA